MQRCHPGGLPGDFYPRPPRGGRPEAGPLLSACPDNFYPRPPRGGRRHHPRLRSGGQKISIHALREEGDLAIMETMQQHYEISIHALREEGDLLVHQSGIPLVVISIHALREEGDLSTPASSPEQEHFYPRPPRGGRRQKVRAPCKQKNYFYPRPPRGGRLADHSAYLAGAIFLSTPSARRATATET